MSGAVPGLFLLVRAFTSSKEIRVLIIREREGKIVLTVRYFMLRMLNIERANKHELGANILVRFLNLFIFP